MKHKTLLWLACAAAVTSPTLWAQDGGEKPASPDPAKQFDKLLAEATGDGVPVPERYARFKKRFAAFAKEHRGTEPGLSAELWLLEGAFWEPKVGDQREAAGEVAARILEYSFHSKRLGALLDYGHLFSGEKHEQICRKILKVTKIPDIQGAAHYTLARLLSKSPGRATEAAKHIRILKDKFPGIPYRGGRLGALASALEQPNEEQAATRGFAVGDRAPEIEGVDLYGKPIRLSDYRGKIVVLDFWGDW